MSWNKDHGLVLEIIILNFNNLKQSFFKTHYRLENDIFCIFNSKEFKDQDIIKLTLKAREYVNQGFLFQTSGTTQDKKFVLHDYSSIIESCNAVNFWIHVDSKDKFLTPISINHMGGFSVLLRNWICNSESAKILMDWSLNSFINSIIEHKITVTSLVPTQIFDIIQAQCRAPDCLRVAFVGGAPLDQSLYLNALKLGWPLLKTFGSTEAGSQIFSQKKPSIDEGLHLLPHWKFKLNSENRLSIYGPSLFKGHLLFQNHEVILQPPDLDAEGYFQTEDHLICDGNTLIQFLGRSHDFIKVNSYLVNLEVLRQRFKKFIKDQNILNSEKYILIEIPDIKSGNKLVIVTDQIDPRFTNSVRSWNLESKPYEAILGIYNLQKLPVSELGKIQLNDIKKNIYP